MAGSRRALLGAICALVVFSDYPSVAGDDDCMSSEVATDPDLGKLPDGQSFLEKLRTEYGTLRVRQVRYDFSEKDKIVRVRQQFILDFSDVINGIRSKGYNQAKAKENCNTSISPRDFALTPDADGNLSGGFSLDTTFRACQIFDVPCIEDWYKITTCRVTWTEDIDSHTFGVNIKIARIFYTKAEKDGADKGARDQLSNEFLAAESNENQLQKAAALSMLEDRVSDQATTSLCSDAKITNRAINTIEADAVSFCGNSAFDERGYNPTAGVRNFLLNIIGIATLNIGSKFVLDTYRSAISDAHSAIDKAFTANLPGRSDLVGGQGIGDVFLSSMKVDQAKTRFAYENLSGDHFVAFDHVTEHPDGQGIKKRTFCELVRPVIAQYGALLRSTLKGDEEVTVDDRTSLWKVAKSAYGSGYYYVTLLHPNGIAFRSADRLRSGTKVVVPPMYKIWTGGDRIVRIGDSLWSIAKRDLGSGTNYKEILAKNLPFLDSARKVYPIQLLQMNH
jgi:nucleoid-associated protein YgaU